MSISTLRKTAYTRRDTLLSPFKKKRKATAKPRNISQLRASGGATRQATSGQKARYASGARYTPRASKGTAGVPSWTKKPLGTKNGVTVYRQYNTPTYYFKRYNTVYRWDTRNKRIYLLDNGLISSGVQVPISSLPQWVKNAMW